MATNPNVEVNRNLFIGGSEIPTIMGINPFQKRWDLLREKVGIYTNDFNGNEYTEYGNALEPQIRNYVNLIKSTNFIEGTFIEGHEVLGIRCNVDGYNEDTILEIKTTSEIHEDVDDYERYLVQLLYYMEHAHKANGILAVYERPKDFNTEFDVNRLHLYEIKYDDYTNLVSRINNAVETFIKDVARLKENPFLNEEELTPQDIVSVSLELEGIEQRLASLKALEAKQKELKAKLLELMVANEVKSWKTINGTSITRVDGTEATTSVVKAFNEDKFKEENEELYNKYLEDKTVETKGRSAYVKITLPKGAKK